MLVEQPDIIGGDGVRSLEMNGNYVQLKPLQPKSKYTHTFATTNLRIAIIARQAFTNTIVEFSLAIGIKSTIY